MEISTILTADVLDIIFDGRNKEYGAYELRRSYKRRLALSITVMLLVMLLLFIGFTFAGKKTEKVIAIEISDPILEGIKEKKIEKVILPPPVKPLATQAQVKTIKDVTFRIVKDNDVRPEDMPPANKDVEDVRIGNLNTDGKNDNSDFIAPPGDATQKGIIEAPKREDEDDNGCILRVEIESEYPGGAAAWQRYLNRNLRYPQEAIDNEIQGAVVVQFIVDKEGNVSDVAAISGPQELRAEAVRVINKSGKWTPAMQNGRKVKSYKKQPIVFRLQDN